ncbi:MAG: hypothetical protein ACTTJX_04710 [Fusobacterium sp.]|uniref:hypothetical protein n=1 Tax=Fusobacterium sp. TaxID=68766 RepID=UPI003FA158BA
MAQWIEDPQGRQEIEKVTKELKLPVWKANYKGKFREFWNEVWSKIEDNFLNLKNIVENKEPTITKKSGFNLDKTDNYNEDNTNKLGTARALKRLYDFLMGKINAIKLNWDKIEDKPSTFPPTSHNHDDRYYTENEINNKFNENILHTTGKEYGGILNNVGNKIAGKTYFDNNTKKLFLCLKNNNNTSANTENFTPIDSNSIHERLENLIKMKVLYNLQALDTNPTEFYLSESVLNYDFIVISAKVKGYNMYSSYFFESVTINNRIINLANDDDAASYYSINGTYIKLAHYAVANWVIYRVLGIKMS